MATSASSVKAGPRQPADLTAVGATVNGGQNSPQPASRKGPAYDNRLATIVGEIALLISTSPSHRHLFVEDFDWLLRPPLALQQYRIFRIEGRPVGYVSWAYLSQEAEARFLETGKLAPADWQSGDRGWLIDFVAPPKTLPVLFSTLAAQTFPNEAVKYRNSRKAGAPVEVLGADVNTPDPDSPPARGSDSAADFVRVARRADCYSLAPRMRADDQRELMASRGWQPLQGLLASFDNAKTCRTIVSDGEVVGMFGVGHVRGQPRTGIVWLLGADGIYDVATRFARESRYWLDSLMDGHDELTNAVDARNAAALRWLKWLGFETATDEAKSLRTGQRFVRISRGA